MCPAIALGLSLLALIIETHFGPSAHCGSLQSCVTQIGKLGGHQKSPVEFLRFLHILDSPLPQQVILQNVSHPKEHHARVFVVTSISRAKFPVLQKHHNMRV